MERFYFDHNATTPVPPPVREALARALEEAYGNPSSVHREGQRARQAVESARLDVCRMIGCAPRDLVFTSGGTESDNLAVLGVVRAAGGHGHVVTSAIEHPAVLKACDRLDATFVRPDRRGWVDPDEVRRAIRADTVLVSLMHSNNETGVVQPIAEIAQVAHDAGVLMHSDGVQAVGKIAVDVRALGVDLYSLSGHKFGAPKGVGALYLGTGVAVEPLQFGGRHERSRRAGTENVPGVVAMAAAARAVAVDDPRMPALRDRLERGVLDRVEDVTVNGAGADRVPNTTNLCFEGVEGEAMVIALDLRGFAVSSGSACSSGAVEPSRVLIAMGLSAERARSSLRFSLGPSNSEQQVDRLVDAVVASCAHLRRLSPAYA